MTAQLCFAIPGHSMIDEIDPATGKSVCFGHTLEQVQARYREAQIMTIDAYCQSKAATQDTPIVWIQCTEEEFDNMLGCLPPAVYNARGFLVGEPTDHHALTGRPRYSAYIRRVTQGEGWSEVTYWTSSRPLTKAEFNDGIVLTA